MFTILPSINVVDLALYIPKHKTLIIGDLHLGIEDAHRRAGMFVPKFNTKEVLERLTIILSRINKKGLYIIVNGDVKHEHGRILDEEWRDIKKVFDVLQERGIITVIVGNHDKFLLPITKKHGIATTTHVLVNDVLIMHGDVLPDNELLKKCKTIIIGHEHPAVSLRDGNRVEKYKCFLKGTYKKKTLLVMPSLHTISEGTNVLAESRLSPFLPKNINAFEIFVVDEKVYPFGTIKQLLKLQKQ